MSASKVAGLRGISLIVLHYIALRTIKLPEATVHVSVFGLVAHYSSLVILALSRRTSYLTRLVLRLRLRLRLRIRIRIVSSEAQHLRIAPYEAVVMETLYDGHLVHLHLRSTVC